MTQGLQNNISLEALTVQPSAHLVNQVTVGDVWRNSSKERKLLLCDAVLEVTASLLNLPASEIRRRGRGQAPYARARQIAIYIAHVVFGLSMSEVGDGFSRERSTVMHACHTIEDMRDDPQFDQLVEYVSRAAKAAFTHLCCTGNN